MKQVNQTALLYPVRHTRPVYGKQQIETWEPGPENSSAKLLRDGLIPDISLVDTLKIGIAQDSVIAKPGMCSLPHSLPLW